MSNWKTTLPTIAFYGTALGTAYLMEEISPSGLCTPGLGILFFLLLPVMSIVLLVKNLAQLLKGQNSKKPVVFAHSAALAICIIALFV